MKVFTWMKLVTLSLMMIVGLFGYGQSDVIISQYIETNSGTTPKGIEVFNVSGSDIVFSGANSLQVYQGTNGASCTERVTITSGTLRANEVWVIGTSNLVSFATSNGANLSGTTEEAFSFNGDDALQLLLGGVLQDEFGVCGSDPGSSWSGGGVSTANNNLEIIDNTCDGDTDGFTNPSERFNVIADGSTMTGFGSISYSCNAGPSAPSVVTDGVSNLTTTSVTLNGIVDDNSSEVTDITFRYGVDAGGPYSNSIAASPSTLPANTGATAVSADLTGLTECETYYFVVEATNALGTSTSDEESFTTVVNNYCASYGNTDYDTGITLVSLAGINNSTPSNKVVGYSDFACTHSATLEQGRSYDLSVNVNTDGGFTIEAVAWIDFNGDGDFIDAGEEFYLGSAEDTDNGPTSLSPLKIDVPIGASAGSTRMRVSARYNAEPTPCLEDFDGEVEDYEIVIIPASLPTVSEIRINEVDSDTPGADDAEFVELFSGVANYPLDNHILVFINGGDREPTAVFDLDGYTTDANGYFIVGGTNAPGFPELAMSDGALQNGPDGVGLYFGNEVDFPNNAEITFSTNLIDALAYGASSDMALENLLNVTETIDEGVNGNAATESIQRGSWFVSTPTPRAVNLPVDLLALEAKEVSSGVKISFSTASEQNNSHFLIQRSLDGRTFETIGRVEGKGDSNEQVDYSFVDAKPAAGLNYYRLQQFDFDGTNAFFGPVAVRFGGAETTKPQVWPVPATDVLQVELPAQDASWNLEVFTINGQLLLEKVVTEKGAQTSFDISALPAGSYFLRWANGREMGQIRFVKQ